MNKACLSLAVFTILLPGFIDCGILDDIRDSLKDTVKDSIDDAKKTFEDAGKTVQKICDKAFCDKRAEGKCLNIIMDFNFVYSK